jgi:hypothetical protein
MKLPRFFFLAFLCLAASAFSAFSIPQDCDKIDANAEVVDSSNGQNNGSVKVNLIKGSLKNLKYIFCAYDNGKVLNESNFQSNTIEGLAPGQYFCVVSNDDCSKKISFTIK